MKYLTSLFALLLSFVTLAQDDVEMADTMRSNGKIYVVLGVVLIIFVGIVVNMIRLERKLNRIEKDQA
ncbi:CcmD family protein [Phaeocystidibacter luteus]|uniref:CcmD family protein n=1 Tax=Phaeocystidibacter luteus TaxID=911197 RepID=A0A6N6RKE8_9FLAO|nr:CcmD family protein [Phaeocystidibacter luteus]KAB2805453.1 CcmD family protein [Phaeocystidibacter luteus]